MLATLGGTVSVVYLVDSKVESSSQALRTELRGEVRDAAARIDSNIGIVTSALLGATTSENLARMRGLLADVAAGLAKEREAGKHNGKP